MTNTGYVSYGPTTAQGMSKSSITTERVDLMEKDLLIHPGEILKEEFLEPHGISANKLAQTLGIPTNRITAIINGTRRITGETAILLGHAFATSPEFWLNLQMRHDLDLARMTVSAEAIRNADHFAKGMAA
jgi:antitoxin HigA-1